MLALIRLKSASALLNGNRLKKPSSAILLNILGANGSARQGLAWSIGHKKKTLSRLEKQLFPYIGNIPISQLETADYLAAIQKAEARGAIETAHRLAQICSQIARYTVHAGIIKYDMASQIRGAISCVPVKHDNELVFPGATSNTRCISDVGLLNALRRMGYSRDKMTVHGFRTSASTMLNEQGYNRDWIEAQLAHAEKNTVRNAYNRADYLPERCKMMCEWTDYLDELGSAYMA